MPITPNNIISPLDILLQKIEIDATTENTKYLIYEYLYGNKSQSEEKQKFIKEVEPSAQGRYHVSKTKIEDSIDVVLRARAGLFRSHAEMIDDMLDENDSVTSKEQVGHLIELRDLLLTAANTMKKSKQYIGSKAIVEKVGILQGKAPVQQTVPIPISMIAPVQQTPPMPMPIPMIAPHTINIWQEPKEIKTTDGSVSMTDSHAEKRRRIT